MLAPLIAILMGFASVAAQPGGDGTIQGVVIDGTRGGEPMRNVAVLLRTGPEGELALMGTTETDLHGRFRFDEVPADPTIVYLPGTNRDGVHYPGPRIRLDPYKKIADVTIEAFEAVQAPSPLAAIRHDIDVHVKQFVVEITESLLVTNPTRATYVGESVDDRPPVTLRLSIPASFDRVTFNDEFHGRRFWIADRQPLTSIPWPPGQRELTYTYRIPLDESTGLFRRTLDMPTGQVRIRIRGQNAEQVSCNLPTASPTGDDSLVAMHASDLPAGFTIEVHVGVLPVPWMRYARWGSVAALAALVLATAIAPRFSRVRSNRQLATKAERLNRQSDDRKSVQSPGSKRGGRRRHSAQRPVS